jgi:hypothetical protein
MSIFSPESFWNQPLPKNTIPHPRTKEFLELTRAGTDSPGLHINLHEWTVPIYQAEAGTPTQTVARRMREDWQGKTFAANSDHNPAALERMGHHATFGEGVPIPPHATADAQEDAHLAIIDPATRTAWDMWGAQRRDDGTWASCTGMRYALDGSGVFDPADFPAQNGESIHPYGPSRATGVPAIAGLILHDEILAGRIAHKLLFACRSSGLLAHYFPPTIWTDGGTPGGPPAGIVLRLNSALDIESAPLCPAGKTVARALQEFGAVLVDFAGGFTLGGEGLWNDSAGRTWHGLLEEDSLFALGLEHFEFLAPEPLGQTLVEKGMVPPPHKSITAQYLKVTGIDKLG